VKVTNICVSNFRLLKDFKIDIEESLSLIIGKNNSGKSSLLTVLDKFISQKKETNEPRFSFSDFNIDALDSFEKNFTENKIDENNSLSIDLTVKIEYSSTDSLRNISRFMTNLDPDRNNVVLLWSYRFNLQRLDDLRREFQEYKESGDSRSSKTIIDYLKKYYQEYFIVVKYSIDTENDLNTIQIRPEDRIEDLINFAYIHAKRDVQETSSKQGSRHIGTLSKLSAQYFSKESKLPSKSGTFDMLSQTVEETDRQLTNDVYPEIFKDLLKRTEDFGVKNESKINVISAINEARILSDNTVVAHRHLKHFLPEDHNGLGYLNLFIIIFQIEVAIKEFAKAYTPNKEKSDINLLFIEEPEAHTHPQLQYIFIKNIKDLLKKACAESGVNLQTAITTHSSHIVAASNFRDVKYFYRKNATSVIAKNLSDLEAQYALDPKQYDFLKQYLTLTSGELFFADKAVLIEGDTERLLLPIIMRKIDLESGQVDDILPLLSQNISVVEVGAYSQVFEKFIEFLGIKTLIITDIDTVHEVIDKNGKKTHPACPVVDGESTCNNALKTYYKDKDINMLRKLNFKDKIISKAGEKWLSNRDGKLCVTYQSEEKGRGKQLAIGRSFEESFIHINFDFVNDNKDNMRGLKNRDDFDDKSKSTYELSAHCIDKKTYFALDIIYFSDEKMSNWKIPAYIKDGLLWLQK